MRSAADAEDETLAAGGIGSRPGADGADFFECLLRAQVQRPHAEEHGLDELEGVLQVASFHPQYQFAGTSFEDIGNYTNRSPFPTLHLLREDSVSRAVDAFPDADDIVDRNVETLDRLGLQGWKKLFDAGSTS